METRFNVAAFISLNFRSVPLPNDYIGRPLAARPHKALEVCDLAGVAIRQPKEKGPFWADLGPSEAPSFAETPTEAARKVSGTLYEQARAAFAVSSSVALQLRVEGETVLKHEGHWTWIRRDTGPLADDAVVGWIIEREIAGKVGAQAI